MATASPTQPVRSAKEKLLPGVRRLVAVASGKGGVGKSTVSTNLALALAASGLKVGLLDADVYGPSIPTILGLKEKPVAEGQKIRPVERFGVKAISTGFFFPAQEAVVWRGPMLHKMIQDLVTVVDWGELDYLLIDLPPGTGDVQISLCQTIPLTGAVIVSTPQDVAWNVAQKAIAMFAKLNTPILGVVENMSGEIFGSGGARKAAEAMKLPFLGEIPLDAAIRKTADAGEPVVQSSPNSASAKAFIETARLLAAEIKKRDETPSGKPTPARLGAPGQHNVDIQWSDGKIASYPARALRINCPCAACVDEVTGVRKLDPARVPADVKALEFHPVGNYALQIRWSDGHDAGLYTYDFLRKFQ